MLRVSDPDPMVQKYIDSEFGLRCLNEGTHCTECVRVEDREIWGVGDAPSSSNYPGLAARKFIRAHKIYEKLGLASPTEIIGAGILRELSAHTAARTRDAFWYEAHGSEGGIPVCIRPCMWQAGQDVLDITILESMLQRKELEIATEMLSRFLVRIAEHR